MIYLASPYTHNNPAIREFRYIQARKFTIVSIKAGIPLFSPIVYGRDMETAIGIDFKPWAPFNDAIIRKADEFWVLKIDGWQDSRGVAHELELAYELNLPISFYDMEGNRSHARD